MRDPRPPLFAPTPPPEAVQRLWSDRALRADLTSLGPSGPRVTTLAVRRGTRPELLLRVGGQQVRLWCAPAPARGAYRHGQTVSVGHAPTAGDARQIAWVLDRLLDRWDARAAALPEPTMAAWRRRADRLRLADHLEALAVASGLKPAARLVVDEPELAHWRGRADQHGLLLEIVRAPAYVQGWLAGASAPAPALLYLARTQQALASAVAAEAAATPGRGQADPQVLGAALGYPSCCMAFFERRPGWSNARLLHAAAEATAERVLPFHLMLRAGDGPLLVSHLPCRLDCPETSRAAAALWATLIDVAPERARAMTGEMVGHAWFETEGGWLVRADARGLTQAVQSWGTPSAPAPAAVGAPAPAPARDALAVSWRLRPNGD